MAAVIKREGVISREWDGIVCKVARRVLSREPQEEEESICVIQTVCQIEYLTGHVKRKWPINSVVLKQISQAAEGK